MAKTFDELRNAAIQIRDERGIAKNTAARLGQAMLDNIDKLEKEFYPRTELDKTNEDLTTFSQQTEEKLRTLEGILCPPGVTNGKTVLFTSEQISGGETLFYSFTIIKNNGAIDFLNTKGDRLLLIGGEDGAGHTYEGRISIPKNFDRAVSAWDDIQINYLKNDKGMTGMQASLKEHTEDITRNNDSIKILGEDVGELKKFAPSGVAYGSLVKEGDTYTNDSIFDVYWTNGDNGGYVCFFRFEIGTLSISPTGIGSDSIIFNKKEKIIRLGGISTLDDILLGVKKDDIPYFNGSVDLKYNNGELIKKYWGATSIEGIVSPWRFSKHEALTKLGIPCFTGLIKVHSKLFTSDDVKSGSRLDYKFEVLEDDGCIRFYDNAGGENIIARGKKGDIVEGNVTIPADFSYCVIEWGDINAEFIKINTFERIDDSINTLKDTVNYLGIITHDQRYSVHDIIFTKRTVKVGTKIEYCFHLLSADGCIRLYDDSGNILDTIGASGVEAGYTAKGSVIVPVNFSYAKVEWNDIQVDYIETVNSVSRVAESFPGYYSASSGVCFGTLAIENSAIIYSGSQFDIYWNNTGVKNFWRIEQPFEPVPITDGSDALYFNTETKKIHTANPPSKHDVLIGGWYNKKLFILGGAKIIDRDDNGNVYKSCWSEKEITDLLPPAPTPTESAETPVGFIVNGIFEETGHNHYTNSSTVDIYWPTISKAHGTGFDRINIGELPIDLTGEGTDALYFNPSTHKIVQKSYADDGYVLIGIRISGKIYLNGDVVIQKLDGDIEKNVYHQNEVLELIRANISDSTPNFVLENSKRTLERITRWLNGSNAYILAQVTDVHSGGSDKYKVIGWMDSLNSMFGFNVMVNAGDTGLDVGHDLEPGWAFDLLSKTKKQMSSSHNWIFCVGNHERNFQREYLGTMFNSASLRNGHKMIFGDTFGNYGYQDDDVQKVRLIFLNTSDTDFVESTSNRHFEMKPAQINWFIDTLKSVQVGWKIIIVQHICPDKMGEWKQYPGDYMSKYILQSVKIMQDYINRRSGNFTDDGANFTWDFTQAKGRLVCVLSGDSHFNNFKKIDGLNLIVRQGYGGCSQDQLPTGDAQHPVEEYGNPTHDVFDWHKECLYDILVVKDDGNAKVFRIGVKDAERDLAITY